MNKLILTIVALPLICGCAGLQRTATGTALGTGGGLVAHKLSKGNPVVTGAGVAGGILISEGFHAWKTSSEKKAFTEGYTLGRSAAVKALYWNLQDQQRVKADSDSFRLYDVTIPEHWEDGVLVKPTQRTLRIQE